MPAYPPSQDETKPDRKAVEQADAGTGSFRATSRGLVIKWGAIGAALVLVLGWGWRYAEARWSAAELAVAKQAEDLRAVADRLLRLEEQTRSASRLADERHADLRSALAKIEAQQSLIQAQLAQIAVSIQRNAR